MNSFTFGTSTTVYAVCNAYIFDNNGDPVANVRVEAFVSSQASSLW